MFKLIITFILVQLAILARYLVYDAFDAIFYVSTYLFLIATVFLYFVSKRFVKKELAYTPNNIASWSFLNRQRIFTNEKPLYKGDVKRGSIQRKFPKKWQYIAADIFGTNFFLALTIKIDENIFELTPFSEKLFSNQSYWTIYKNGQKIGSAKTVIDLKNTAKLKEVIELQISDEIYSTAASTVTSQISLVHNNQHIGEMKRNHLISNVNIIDLNYNSPDRIIALILHAYYFKNG